MFTAPKMSISSSPPVPLQPESAKDKPSVPMAMLIKCRGDLHLARANRKEALREICKAYGYEVTEE